MNEKQKKIVTIIGIAFGVLVLGLVTYFIVVSNSLKTSQPEVVKVEATPTPQVVATPEPTKDPHEGKVQSSLNGKWVSEKVEKKRPFAIMINNIEYAFMRQKGTSQADIIYEALAEGGITRMLAVYQDVAKVKKIGSVRSARHYYVQFAYEWNAIYCHFGQTKYAISKMKKLKTNNLSGLSAIGPVVYARDFSINPPHNVYTNGKKMIKGAKKLKYSLKQNKSKQAEHFTFNENDTNLDSSKKAKSLVLPFSYYSTVKLKYDKKKKVYAKYEYNKKHMDRQYKKQLKFKNVIIQYVKEKNKDHNGYQTMDLNTSGKGIYCTNGKKINITWTRNEKKHEMVYKTADGETLSINPGKTYIAVFPKKRKKLVKIK